MKLKSKLITLAALAAVCLQAGASTVTIGFDELSSGSAVGEFYNGAHAGTNYGVSFNDFTVISGYGQTSQPNLAYVNGGLGIIDVAAGFDAVSFTYGNFSSTTYGVWSGLDGTGTLLGTATYTGNPFAFAAGSVAFSGDAHSLVMTGNPGEMGLDDLKLTTSVPEPASFGLLLGGLALLGAAGRHRKA